MMKRRCVIWKTGKIERRNSLWRSMAKQGIYHTPSVGKPAEGFFYLHKSVRRTILWTVTRKIHCNQYQYHYHYQYHNNKKEYTQNRRLRCCFCIYIWNVQIVQKRKAFFDVSSLSRFYRNFQYLLRKNNKINLEAIQRLLKQIRK